MDSSIGIIGIEVYFPKTYISQTELEDYNSISPGKYTIGLGQTNMAFTNNRHDVISMSMTVVESLMNKYNVSYTDIGRLEVGTESSVDKSKSIKTYLMDLFKKYNNYNIEGVDTINACYGGTQAIFNSLAWLQTEECKNRYAIVVMSDIAEYEVGPALPSGGCGSIAILLGKNAPIVFESGTRYTYMDNVYDFFKPIKNSPYPVVDGELSKDSYIKSLDNCYRGYVNNLSKNNNIDLNFINDTNNLYLFHTPYCKLVQKAVAYLKYLSDFPNNTFNTYNKIIEKKYLKKSEIIFKNTQRSLLLSSELGNTYTASLWMCLASLIYSEKNLLNKKIMMFSYGSGLASTIFCLKIVGPTDNISNQLQLQHRLQERVKCNPYDYYLIKKNNELNYNKFNLLLSNDFKSLFDNDYFLSRIDNGKRIYLKYTNILTVNNIYTYSYSAKL